MDICIIQNQYIQSSNLFDFKSYNFVTQIKISTLVLRVYLSAIILGFVLYGCANTGLPDGGPKDIVPPKVVKSVPADNSLNFKGDEVVITFDELIKIEGMDEKFVSSPPLKKRPAIQARGRQLIIKFDEELQQNATYTLDFADAIKDYNESNTLPNFRTSFSTGSVIDSLAISGRVFNANDLSPVDGALVLLYSNLNDSAFRTEVPLRLSKTDAQGNFSIHNIAAGDYRVYALNDANRNYYFDQVSEEIGWDSQIITPSIEYRNVVDTTLQLSLKNDSLAIDTLVSTIQKVNLPNNIQLFLYQEDYKKVYLEDYKRIDRFKVDLFFSRAVDKELTLSLANDSSRVIDSWALRQRSLGRDTISFWITDTLVANQDSLPLVLKYHSTDSLDKPFIKVDTLVAYYFSKEPVKVKLKKGEKPPVPVLEFTNLPTTIDHYSSYPIQLASPAVKFNKSGIKLFQVVDTISKPISFDLVKDTLLATRYFIKNKWQYNTTYFVSIDSATFINCTNRANNKINRKIEIKPENSYGLLLCTLENYGNNWLVQLVNSNDEVVRQQYIPKNGKMAFQFIKPADYFIKIVEDRNRNRRYDVGNYKKGELPEKVIYYPEKVSIRPNWRHEITWDVSTFSLENFVEQNRKSSNKQKKK